MRRILVVDDRSEICELIETFLTERGYAVDRAVGSLAARQMLAQRRYGAALLDVLMPGEGGVALAEFIAGQGTPVLLMSGQPEALVAEASSGAYAVLSKPFRLTELEAAVDALFEDAAPHKL